MSRTGLPAGIVVAVELDVLASRSAGDGVAGGLEPQRLVDHAGEERAVLDDLAPLVGVLGEELGQPADQPTGRLVAGAGDDRGVGEDLLAGERPRLAVLVLELGVQQLGHQVVGGVRRTAIRCSRRTCRRWRPSPA